jgi:sigma-54 specific flagellar transcriptional regulator A
LEPAVMQCLASYSWPGNVRELENLVERISVCAENEVIRISDLPLGIRAPHLGSVETASNGVLGGFDVSSLAVQPVEVAEVTNVGMAEDATAPVTDVASEPFPLKMDLASFGDMVDSSLAREATELREASRAAGASDLEGSTPTPIMQFPVDLPTMLRELENRYINAALAHTGSNKKEAAKLLGMGRTTLVEKLRRRSTDVRPLTEDE